MAAPQFASAVVALTGSTQTITLFTAGTQPNSTTELTDLTLESSAAGPFDIQVLVNGVVVEQYQVGSATPLQVDHFESRPTAVNGQTIQLVLPAGTSNITYNAAAQVT